MAGTAGLPRTLFQFRVPKPPATSAGGPGPATKTAVLSADPMAPGPGEHVLLFRVRKVLFSRGEFHVALGRPTGDSRKNPVFADKEDIIVAGEFSSLPEEGLDYRLVGRFQPYKGRETFRPRLAVEELPRSAKGIASWLRRQNFPGIGKIRITRIAKAAAARGEDALGDIRFLEEQGLTPEEAERVAATWLVSGAEARAKAQLFAFGVKGPKVKAAWETKGAALLAILDERPWELCSAGLAGFAICDRIALHRGMSLDHPERRRAAVLEAVRVAGLEGHTAVPREELLQRAARLSAAAPSVLHGPLAELLREGRLVETEDGVVQLAERHQQEDTLARALLAPERRAVFASEHTAVAALLAAEERLGVRLDREGGQFAAAVAALTAPITVISGGPGTGKTTTQRVIVEALRAAGLAPLLLSPTGRAAKRLAEVTGAQAYTVAKINFLFPTGRVTVVSPQTGEDDDPGMVIVDEASMLCVDNASYLLRFTPPRTPIVFVGDNDQLPSVGPGAVLRDIIESGCAEVRWLERIHRQRVGNDIPQAARAVLARQVPSSGSNIEMLPCADAELVTAVPEIVRGLIEQRGFRPDEVQVLVPMKRGPIGAYALNSLLRPLLNPQFSEHKDTMRSVGGFQFCVGDRVMNIKNDYSKNVMNGDMGVVRELIEEKDDTKILVDFDGDIVEYSAQRDDVEETFPLIPCYATTVHKAQGSEFAAVVVMAPAAHERMLGRNLVYTALTRAKSRCVVIGDLAALAAGLRSVDVVPRQTRLSRQLLAARGVGRRHELETAESGYGWYAGGRMSGFHRR